MDIQIVLWVGISKTWLMSLGVSSSNWIGLVVTQKATKIPRMMQFCTFFRPFVESTCEIETNGGVKYSWFLPSSYIPGCIWHDSASQPKQRRLLACGVLNDVSFGWLGRRRRKDWNLNPKRRGVTFFHRIKKTKNKKNPCCQLICVATRLIFSAQCQIRLLDRRRS